MEDDFEFEGFYFLDKIEDVEDIIKEYEEALKDEYITESDRELWTYNLEEMQSYLQELKEDAEQEAKQEAKREAKNK